MTESKQIISNRVTADNIIRQYEMFGWKTTNHVDTVQDNVRSLHDNCSNTSTAKHNKKYSKNVQIELIRDTELPQYDNLCKLEQHWFGGKPMRPRYPNKPIVVKTRLIICSIIIAILIATCITAMMLNISLLALSLVALAITLGIGAIFIIRILRQIEIQTEMLPSKLAQYKKDIIKYDLLVEQYELQLEYFHNIPYIAQALLDDNDIASAS